MGSLFSGGAPTGMSLDQYRSLQQPFKLQGLPQMPGAAPTVTDMLGQLAQQKKMSSLLTGGSRKSTYLTGPLGDQSAAPIGTKTLLGS